MAEEIARIATVISLPTFLAREAKKPPATERRFCAFRFAANSSESYHWLW